MKVKLQFGVDHAKEVGATHHRRGDLYKVTSRVECWDCGEWVDVDHPLKVSEWLEELETINWSDLKCLTANATAHIFMENNWQREQNLTVALSL